MPMPAVLAVFAAQLLVAPVAWADVVETLGGSIIRGRVIASQAGVVKIETDFGGTVEIGQAQVKSIVTDEPIFVALKNGNTVEGRMEKAAEGVRVAGASASLQTAPTEIAAVWRAGDETPADRAAAALRRHWTVDVAFDLNGRQGNSDRMFVGASLRAELAGPDDRLVFAGSYNQATENEVEAQDDARAGVDFSSYFSPRQTWYVRTEIGYDNTKQLDLRSQSGVGLGHSFIKKPNQSLEGRVGLNYRYESYAAGDDVSLAGLDLGVLHSLDMRWGRIVNSLTITPAFEDFGNFVLTHESAIEFPFAGSAAGKMRLGLKNDYTSEPPAGLEKHDWSYFSQLVFTWK